MYALYLSSEEKAIRAVKHRDPAIALQKYYAELAAEEREQLRLERGLDPDRDRRTRFFSTEFPKRPVTTLPSERALGYGPVSVDRKNYHRATRLDYTKYSWVLAQPEKINPIFRIRALEAA